MIDPQFLGLLRCPSTRQPLREATPQEVAAVNAALAGGTVRNRAGEAVAQPVEVGLVTADGSALYPVIDGIPILLSAEAIPLESPATES